MITNKRTWIILAMVLFLVFCTGPINAESSSLEGPWELVVQTTVTQPTRMAAFLNESFGITGGFSGAGKSHFTLDGGKTWTKAESSGGCLYGIEIVDEKTVWVCGRMTGVSFKTPGGIRPSLDGGKTYEPSTSFVSSPGECPMSFLDDKTGWAYQDGLLCATNDGGKTWVDLDLPLSAKQIKAVAIVSEKIGFALERSGVLYLTVDGGKTWDLRKLPMDRFKELKIPKFEGAAAAMRFFNKDNGIVVLSLTGSQAPRVVALRTKDGGATWEDEYVGGKVGVTYLSPDGKYVTTAASCNIHVYRYKGN
jgi:photosystem II stability/assembly factor-like uncharacterized protein